MTKPIKNETPLEVSTDIIPQNNNSFNLEALISQGIDKGMSVDSMERLLAMRKELKAEWAKERFTNAMADFQAQCPTIQKTKEVKTKSGQVAYRYAPIESIVQQVAPYLKQNGFSYSANMELIENGTTKVKATIKVTHIDGHSESNEMTVPLGNKTDIMSQSQVVAAAQTFAKRYAFCNAFGILTGDEDNDGAVDGLKEKPDYTAPRYSTPTKATPKQLDYIKKLCDLKGITLNQLKELKITYNTPSEMIGYLQKLPDRKSDELPIITVGNEDEELRKIADSIPF